MKSYLSLMFYNYKKVMAIFVANCFLFSFCFAPTANAVAQAAADNARAAKENAAIFESFSLPYSWGKITDSGFTGSNRIIVTIQDLHCHPEAQKNISNIIG